MPHYRLHYFPESGNSFKLALMLTLCGQPFEGIWTDFNGGVTRSKEWRAAVNPMGEIPVLEVDGEKLTQTAPILLQLAQQFGKFGGATDAERYEILRWLFWDNHKLTGYMATYRFQRAFMTGIDPQVQTYFRRRLGDFLGILETHLQSSDFAIGMKPSVADISMMAYLHFPADEHGFDFATSHPAIRAWLDRMATLPGYKPAYELLPGQRMTNFAKSAANHDNPF